MAAKECIKCPKFTVTCYQDVILLQLGFFFFFLNYSFIKIGYWRSSVNSDVIYFCEDFSEKCMFLKIYLFTYIIFLFFRGDYLSACWKGYEGPLCSVCSRGYSKLGTSDCSECSDPSVNTFSLVGFFVLFVIFLGAFLGFIIFKIIYIFLKYYRFSVKQSDQLIKRLTSYASMKVVKDATNDRGDDMFDMKKGVSIYLKIMLNYIQSISIIQSLELKWPYYVKSYMNVYSNAGSVSTQVISLDCMVNDYNIHVETIYAETVFSIILPFLCFLISFIALCIVHVITKKSQKIRFIVIVIVGSIFLQPMIIKILFKNLVCKQINETSFLISNLKIQCDSDSHINW